MITRVYKCDIQATKKGDRTYKKFIFTYLLEFKWNTTSEWLEKTKYYMNNYDKIHFVDMEKSGDFYIYMRYKKYKLDKGVNEI